jgi:hypothetical protein
VALTPGTLWIQQAWRLRSLALRGLEIERQPNGKELGLTLDRESTNDTMVLTFADASEEQRWYEKICHA